MEKWRNEGLECVNADYGMFVRCYSWPFLTISKADDAIQMAVEDHFYLVPIGLIADLCICLRFRVSKVFFLFWVASRTEPLKQYLQTDVNFEDLNKRFQVRPRSQKKTFQQRTTTATENGQTYEGTACKKIHLLLVQRKYIPL